MKDTTNLAYSIDKEVFKEDGADHFTASLSVDNWFARIECHGETKGEASQMASFVYYAICNNKGADELAKQLRGATNAINCINEEYSARRESDAIKIAGLEASLNRAQLLVGKLTLEKDLLL